ncbi:MAG: hypothetical protein HF982_10770 [Desulfobacteraceae bacterium]|nr:hypothetical protein [Desulfobacteraceae bacterium]MBC2720048.1 hypothetical protein [Desulfobacteraceae bacterium]
MGLVSVLKEEGRQEGIQQGMQQGIQQGMQQSARESVIDILELRFEIIPKSILNRLNEIYDPSILKILHRKAIKVNSLEEFEQIINLMMK